MKETSEVTTSKKSDEGFDPNVVSPTFCVMPWFNLATETNGKCKICCVVMDGSYVKDDQGGELKIQENPIEDIWNSAYMKRIRMKMLDGEEISDCSFCKNQEAIGASSPRGEFSNRWMSPNLLEVVEGSKQAKGRVENLPQSLEPRPGITCNLKCNMCWSMSSSKVFSERKKWMEEDEHRPVPESVKETWQDEIDFAKESDFAWANRPIYTENLRKCIPGLRRLYFTGGEPVLIESNIKALEELVEQGNTDLLVSFTTNLTKVDDRLLSVLGHFKHVEITGSIDAYGTGNDYIRYPSQWSVVTTNLSLLRSLPNVVVSIMSVAQLCNALSLLDLFDWVIDNSAERQIQVMPTVLRSPDYLRLSIMPESIRERALRRLEQVLCREGLSDDNKRYLTDLRRHYFIRHPESRELRNQFLEVTQFVDASRGTDFFAVFPEFQMSDFSE